MALVTIVQVKKRDTIEFKTVEQNVSRHEFYNFLLEMEGSTPLRLDELLALRNPESSFYNAITELCNELAEIGGEYDVGYQDVRLIFGSDV